MLKAQCTPKTLGKLWKVYCLQTRREFSILLSQQKCLAVLLRRMSGQSERTDCTVWGWLNTLQSLCYCCSLQGLMISEKHLHYPRNILTGCLQITATLPIIIQEKPSNFGCLSSADFTRRSHQGYPRGAHMEDAVQSRQSGIPGAILLQFRSYTSTERGTPSCDQGLCWVLPSGIPRPSCPLGRQVWTSRERGNSHHTWQKTSGQR